MRWIFGQQQQQKNGDIIINNNITAPTTTCNSTTSTPSKQENNIYKNLNKKRKSFASFFRSSLRNSTTTSKSIDCTRGKNSSLIKNNSSLLTSSRTFDAPRSTHLSPDRFCPSISPAPSACHSEPAVATSSGSNGQLDRSLMQICTDVKYENRRRPKFAAVVDANFQRQCLQAHNHVRQVLFFPIFKQFSSKIYGIPPLIWSQELAELAKTWALKLTQRGRLLFPELPGIGENIYLLTAFNNTSTTTTFQDQAESFKGSTGDHLTTGNELVALWASEARYFDFTKPRWSQECRHFSQMIWRGSMEMGVARHWNTSNDCVAIVVFYRPSGNCNLPGEFSTNLPNSDDVPEYALEATSLQSLSQALNRTDLGDGGFPKKGAAALPPRSYSSTNSTKILKC